MLEVVTALKPRKNIVLVPHSSCEFLQGMAQAPLLKVLFQAIFPKVLLVITRTALCQEEDTSNPFFDDIVEKDALLLLTLREKAMKTEIRKKKQ
ncbi:hypothetical protein Tco_1483482 [Tanacetum coccineum]